MCVEVECKKLADDPSDFDEISFLFMKHFQRENQNINGKIIKRQALAL